VESPPFFLDNQSLITNLPPRPLSQKKENKNKELNCRSFCIDFRSTALPLPSSKQVNEAFSSSQSATENYNIFFSRSNHLEVIPK